MLTGGVKYLKKKKKYLCNYQISKKQKKSDNEINIIEPNYNLKKNKSFDPNNINTIDKNKREDGHDIVNNNGAYLEVKDKDFDIIKEALEIIKYDNRLMHFIIFY